MIHPNERWFSPYLNWLRPQCLTRFSRICLLILASIATTPSWPGTRRWSRSGLPARAAGRTHTGCTLDSAAHIKPEHDASAARSWPSVEKADGYTDRTTGTDPSAIRPWTPQHAALQRDKVTVGGTEKKRPA